jgi:hypothetical protein
MMVTAMTALPMLLAAVLAAPATSPAAPALVVVVGAGGTPEYAVRFREAAERWRKTGERAGAPTTVIGLASTSDARTDLAELQTAIASATRTPGGPLWIVLIGHGTFDGRVARFNLRGPDVSAPELAGWLKPLRRPLVFLNTASASAPFVNALTGPDRIIVTATKTGAEQNVTRFGPALAEAIADTRADLDRDGAVSLLEAFLYAGKRVEASYLEEGLLATEHALLEDNGDGLGTSAALFRGLSTAETAAADPAAARDGSRARQITLLPAAAEPELDPATRRRRDELELAIADLQQRRRRDKLPDNSYYARLEKLLMELARLYRGR